MKMLDVSYLVERLVSCQARSVHETKDLSAGRPASMLTPLRGVVRVRVRSSNLIIDVIYDYCPSVNFDQEHNSPGFIVYDKERV